MYRVVHKEEAIVPRLHFEIDVQTSAAPERIFALLVDHAGWPTWSPVGSYRLERAGPEGPEGLGTIRVFRTRWWGRTITVREQIVELDPPRRFAYALLSGMPLRGYRAVIDLTALKTGTWIHWHSSFDAKVPGTGWLYRRVLAGFAARTLDGLTARAEREPSLGVSDDG
jgi:hypothetical protein